MIIGWYKISSNNFVHTTLKMTDLPYYYQITFDVINIKTVDLQMNLISNNIFKNYNCY